MFKDLNPVLHSQIRLSIISILMIVETADFLFIQKKLNATAGNISANLEKLREAGYVDVEKFFDGKKPRTKCRITPRGIGAFNEYFEAIQSYYTK